MTIDSPAAPKTGRIAGTLHTRGHIHPTPLQDQNLHRERVDESVVEGRHTNSGPQNHGGAR